MAQPDSSDSDAPEMETEETPNASHANKQGVEESVIPSDAEIDSESASGEDSADTNSVETSDGQSIEESIEAAGSDLQEVIEPAKASPSENQDPADVEFQKDVSNLLGQLDSNLENLGKDDESESVPTPSDDPDLEENLSDLEIPADPVAVEDSEEIGAESEEVAESPNAEETTSSPSERALEAEASASDGASPMEEPEIETVSDENADEAALETDNEAEIAAVFSENEEESDETETSETPSLPSSDDLLKQASSVLNGDDAVDLDALSLEDESDLEEDIPAMPSPDSLISEASSNTEVSETSSDQEASDSVEEVPSSDSNQEPAKASEDDDDLDEEVMAMPDPQALMNAAATGEKVDLPETEPKAIDDSGDEPEPQAANVADRGGELPPPPPAPVAIDDDDEIPEPEVEENDESESGASDPFADDSLDGFNTDEAGDVDSDQIESLSGDGEESSDEAAFSISDPIDELQELEELEDLLPIDQIEAEETAEVVKFEKPSLVSRILRSTTLAASLFFVGLSIILSSYKLEVVEYLYGKDFDASLLSHRIAEVANEVLSGINEEGYYEMRSVHSRIKRVSSDEIRINMTVEAQLKKNLYLPISDDVAMEKFDFDPLELNEWQKVQEKDFPGVLNVPHKPWEQLYRISEARGKTVPLKITYLLNRESKNAEWDLAEVRIRGEEGPLEWPEGEPMESFGDLAYDVESAKFAPVFGDYKEHSDWYVEKVRELSSESQRNAVRMAELKRKNEDRLIGALAQGSYFKGMAIVGDQAEDAREVFMVVTDTRDNGSLIKGIFKLHESDNYSKHFTGFLDFREHDNGEIEGLLKITTVAFEGERSYEALPQFFNPGTVTRINLRTDGHSLEGDSNDVSLRLVRTL